MSRVIDMFDCVMPTRNARKGSLFVRGGRGKINIRNARFKFEKGRLRKDVGVTCQRFSAGYLRHLLKVKEL